MFCLGFKPFECPAGFHEFNRLYLVAAAAMDPGKKPGLRYPIKHPHESTGTPLHPTPHTPDESLKLRCRFFIKNFHITLLLYQFKIYPAGVQTRENSPTGQGIDQNHHGSGRLPGYQPAHLANAKEYFSS